MRKRRQWSEEESPAANTRRLLPGMAAELFRLGRRAADSADAAELHAFRLEAKHFRYTLEMFAPVYGPGLERRLRAMRKLQGHLGDISDVRATAELIRAAPPDCQAAAETLRAWLHREALRRTSRFRSYWRKTFDAQGEEKRWSGYLRRAARDRGRRAEPQPAEAPSTTPRKRPAVEHGAAAPDSDFAPLPKAAP